MIYGNTTGIKKRILEELEELYNFPLDDNHIISDELATIMLSFTKQYNRELAVYINRYGKVVSVAIGDNVTVSLPQIKNRGKLCGIRCIHTHPGGDAHLSMPDISSLLAYKFDLMVALAEKEGRILSSIASIKHFETGSTKAEVELSNNFNFNNLLKINFKNYLNEILKIINQDFKIIDNEAKSETAILIAVNEYNQYYNYSIEDSIEELSGLAKTAGLTVAGKIIQKRDKADSLLYLGKGKLNDLSLMIQNVHADLIICDSELTPLQQKNLSNLLGIKVLDRTTLILDIFAQRAISSEGKLQVELAQLRYLLPRLNNNYTNMSRQGGGVGTRGPGETKLELDRRKIQERIKIIENQVQNVKKQRDLQRKQRLKTQIPTAALVGYTNAGKSSILNLLTNSDVRAKDELFATLDTTTRLLEISDNRNIFLIDTVGFIQKLPHTLIKAFNATLEEVCEADILLHVVDCSDENYEQNINAVLGVLQELGAANKPMLYVFNKIDLVKEIDIRKYAMLKDRQGLFISTKAKIGIDSLLEYIKNYFSQNLVTLKMLIPYSDGAVLDELHNIGKINNYDYRESGTEIVIELSAGEMECYKKFILE